MATIGLRGLGAQEEELGLRGPGAQEEELGLEQTRRDKTKSKRVQKEKKISIEHELMKLDAKHYKKLLIAMDSDKPWFEQVILICMLIARGYLWH